MRVLKNDIEPDDSRSRPASSFTWQMGFEGEGVVRVWVRGVVSWVMNDWCILWAFTGFVSGNRLGTPFA